MYQSIKEILESPVHLSTYKGSKNTKDMVAEEIKKKYGVSELKNYNPYNSMMTYASWFKLGYVPKKGEKAIKSTTYVEVKDDRGKILRKVKRSVNLFYYRQMQQLKPKEL
ncbi:MAG: hypothetical protein V4665_04395 [Patescibacteria group bacterium]